MPKPRSKRDPNAIAHVIDTVSDDAADLTPTAPPPAAPKPIAKNKRTDYKKLLVYTPELEPYGVDGKLNDYYSLPNGRWVAVQYSGKTATGIKFSDSGD